MPTDAYIKFGNDPDPSDDTPYYEGDCTDETHLYWCELRDTNFGLEFPDEEQTGDGASKEKKKQTVKHDKVTLKKRVDWASTPLFLKCCQAGKAKIEKNKSRAKELSKAGTIDNVTVHICKSAGPTKFPFIVITYSGVRVVKYQIDMSDPEPSESIEIEYDSVEFEFQETDPYSGLPVVGKRLKSTPIECIKDSESVVQSDGAASAGGDTPSAGLAPPGAAGGNASAYPGLVSATDTLVATNFPGLWGATGLDVLPD